ncbi:FtsX-like permease family protein [Miniphocaeibacter halophilus]|uniref:ABC transporter permease n=1 Tax=Miniphocaeibacter halophilus TaxID=2931922 RepID=A0AC61MTT2_9FIRM|nr:ABC transporter permease [Miniphocaeibacter halophilus]QQK09042.1 ABC transporter permease [Miniphocaeibacter halophilus]
MKLIFKLSKENIRRNKELYLPYIFVLILSVVLFFLCINLTFNDFLNEEIKNGYIVIEGEKYVNGIGAGYDALKEQFQNVSIVIGIISLIFTLYIGNFIYKRRSMDYGVYDILGMDKKHIQFLVISEILILGLPSILLGILGGIALNKLNFLFISRILDFGENIKSQLSLKSICITFVVFLSIEIILCVIYFFKIYFSHALQMIGKKKYNLRKKKFYIFESLAGILLILFAYYLSFRNRYTGEITARNIIQFNDIVEVSILLLIGTFLIYQGLTVIVFSYVKKQRIYKRKDNFITLSNLAFRFRENAISLTIISIVGCILLNFIASSILNYNGFVNNYNDIDLYTATETKKDSELLNKKIINLAEENGLGVKEKTKYEVLNFLLANDENNIKVVNNSNNYERYFTIIRNSEYNNISKIKEKVKDNEVIILGNSLYYGKEMKNNILPEISLFENNLKVKTIREISSNENLDSLVDGYGLIVSDNIYEKIINSSKFKNQESLELVSAVYIVQDYKFDGDFKTIKEFLNKVEDHYSKAFNVGMEKTVVSTVNARYLSFIYVINGAAVFYSTYITLIFLINFFMILYYKQIVEGYEDANQFKKLYKIGLSEEEIGESVQKQIKIFFLVPLLISIIHFLLTLSLSTNMASYIDVTSMREMNITFLVSIILYIIIYSLTYVLTSKKYNSLIIKGSVIKY